MRTRISHLFAEAIYLLAAIVACALAFKILPSVDLITPVHAQGNSSESTKTLIVDGLYRTDPIEVMKVLCAGNEAQPGACSKEDDSKWILIFDGGHYPERGPAVGAIAYRLQSDDNWLSNLSFVLKNRTSKRIILVAITIVLPLARPSHDGPPYAKGVQGFPFGQLPAVWVNTRHGDRLPATTKNPIRFDPGQEMSFTLADRKNFLDGLVARAQPLSESTLCRVRIRVFFEDGLDWREGDYYKPDPERPGEPMLMDQDYFPGSLAGPSAP
jgi:hypothetical protein